MTQDKQTEVVAMKSTALKKSFDMAREEAEPAKTLEGDSAQEHLSPELRLAKSLVPLKSLTESHLQELVKNSSIEVVFRGQTLFEAGSYDRDYIYLLHGDIELLDNESKVTLVRGASSVTPIAHSQPRPCRAMAKSDCSILRVDAEYLDKMLTWSQVSEYMLLDISYQRDLDEDAEWIMTVLKSNLFYKVPPTNASYIFDRMKSMTVEAGMAVLRQGEIGDNCYFIKQGEAEVSQSADGKSLPVKIAEIGPGRCFGEDALVNETSRNATVTMKTDGVLMYISKRDFQKLLKEPKAEVADDAEIKEMLAKDVICIDVRTEAEYESGHLEQAINIPLNLLRIKTRLLDANTPYILYCDTGRRSQAASHLLNKAGFKVTSVKAGLRGLRKGDGFKLETGQQGFVLRDGGVIRGK
ncbi:hypothetical protein NBRC116493_14130 [Aurantivibrio infirmus]